ncbi:MAG: divalent-cation tolerance protein CutA [Candidatus Sericytochromatia bacterium]|nr:divalent-cation tolerance protein CutA [Candidatus Sericytochromatia bacterium]
MKLLLTTCAQEAVDELISSVLTRRLAACCNCIPGVKSTYWWNNELTTEQECLLIFKTSAESVDALLHCLQTEHPYELPELLVIEPSLINSAYENWVRSETLQGV